MARLPMRARLMLTLAAVAVLAACGSDDDPEPKQETPLCMELGTCAPQTGCAAACPEGQLCVRGSCRSSCDETVCSGSRGPECVSLMDDLRHCGECNNACSRDDVCVDGECVQDCGMLTACDAACVDLLSDDAHCGACGADCAAGTTCTDGVCTCGAGLDACADECVDTSADAEHCGACGQTCRAGERCEQGACVGPDGCTDRPVAGLSLHAIDVYQTVQIPIMAEGAAVAAGERNADVVAGRSTVFRVHVVPEAGWSPRSVSARLELTDVELPDQSQAKLFYQLLTPRAASSDEELDSTFQVKVPAEAIGPNTRYAITLRECEGATTASPDAAAPKARFPSAGFADLEARETGPLKVHIIPISGTDVTEEGLRPFKERLEAVYPITEVQFTFAEPLRSFAGSMCSLLASVTSRRSQDRPPDDVYYYGLAPGILGGQSGCSTTSSGARGSKVSAGWAQGYRPDDGRTGAGTMCHELGHAHGRFHAPCRVQDPDPRYPYAGADIGVWGYDRRSDEFYEPTRKDMMSYCPEPRWAAWISDYTYQAILERVVEVNAQAALPLLFDTHGTHEASWRLLVSDSAGVHWMDEPLLLHGTPEGEPMRAVIHGDGGPMQAVEVYWQQLEDGVREGAFMLTLPEPDESWRAIELPGVLAPEPF